MTNPTEAAAREARGLHHAKLKERDVLELRRLYRDGGWTLRQLAERYRVSRSAVCAAARGVSWSHLEAPAD